MIKFISAGLIVLILLSLVLTGCTEANESDNAASSNSNNEAQIKENEREEGQRDRRRPDMFGRVKSIIGNEIVLEIAEMPQRPTNKSGEQGNKTAGVPGGGNGDGERPRGVGMREIKLTGETATLLIPVGIPISTRSQNGMKEIDLADIYVGATLQIWFDDEETENKTITNVVMIQGRE